MNHLVFGTLVILSVLCGAATAFTYKEDFEAFPCNFNTNGLNSVFQGQGTMSTGPFTYIDGYGCSDPVVYCSTTYYSRNGRMLMDGQNGASRTFNFPVVHEYFSGYFGTCFCGGGCSNRVDMYFYQGPDLVGAENFNARNDGILGFREFRVCFDRIVIVGDGLMLDDLTINRTPPTIQCPEYLPARLYERFEDFNCGKQPSSFQIFAGKATIIDANPFIWGNCASYSLCYTNGVVSDTRSYGHDDLLGSVTIQWGKSVFGFGGKFAPCLGTCCSNIITFQFYDGTYIVYQEDVTFGNTGGVMTPYSHTVTFDRVVITGKTWAMDDIFYVDKADLVIPTDVNQCQAFVDFRAQAIDVCSTNSLTYSPTQPDTYYLPGRYWLTATATDRSGTSTCDFQVVVADLQEPTIVCPNDIVTVAPAGTCSKQVTYTTTFSDNCNVLTSQTVVPASNSVFQVGRTKVVASAVDQYGNDAQCDFTVEVQDTQLPTITCPAPVTVTVNDRCGSIVTWAAPVTGDNCVSQGLTVIATYPSGFFFPIGTTANTLTVLDSSGNSASCTFNVIVVDATKLCFCGNGVVDTGNGETCEVNQLGGRTCQSFLNNGVPIYPDGGVLDCTNCQYDFTRCAVCGDGRVDGTEECDGSNLNSLTCLTQGFTGGSLSCSNKCKLVTTACTSCGNGVVDGSEECDTNAFNGKTCADFYGAGATGTLACTARCTIDAQGCNGGPRVTAPAAASTQYLTRGISVQATGFINDAKASVSMTDGTSTQNFGDLVLSRGSLSVTLFPTTLKVSTTWKVSVKGTTTQFKAQSGVFTVKSS